MLVSFVARTKRANDVDVRRAPAIAAIETLAHSPAINTTSAAERHCDRRLVRAQSSAAAIDEGSVDRGGTAVVDDATVAHPYEALRGIGHGLVVGDQQDRLAA